MSLLSEQSPNNECEQLFIKLAEHKPHFDNLIFIIQNTKSLIGLKDYTPSVGKIGKINNSNIKNLKEKLSKRIKALKGNRKDPKPLEGTRKQRNKENKKKTKTKTTKQGNSTKTALLPVLEKKIKIIKETQKDSNEVKDAISFGLIDFGTKVVNKNPKDTLGKLKKVQSEKEKFDKFAIKNPEKAKEVLENKQWTGLMQKAQGEKIKDDPKLLEKTLKREAKIKLQKSKKWTERKDHNDYVKKGKEDKRTKNIQQRIDTIKEKNLKKRKK